MSRFPAVRIHPAAYTAVKNRASFLEWQECCGAVIRAMEGE